MSNPVLKGKKQYDVQVFFGEKKNCLFQPSVHLIYVKFEPHVA